MKTLMFAIYDRAADVYNVPFFLQHAAIAKRAFSNSIIDGKNELHKNPEDYALHELGSFDDSTGEFDLHEKPQFLIDADQVLELHYATSKKDASNG